MQDLKQLENAVEQIKKEVWYIAKVTIPSLKALIGGGSEIKGLKQLVENNTESIAKNSASISSLSEQMTTNSGKIDSNAANITTNANNIASNASNITSNTSNISSNTARINQCESNITSLENELDNLTSLININSNKILNVENSINTMNSSLSSLNTTMNENTAKIETMQTNITNISNWKSSTDQEIANIKSQIEGLSGGSSGSGEVVDLIYDSASTDPNINRGFTTGMVGGAQFSVDLTQYKKIIVYGALNKNDAVAISYLETRKFTDVTLHNASVGLNKFWYLKITIPATKNKVVVNQAGYYEVNATTGAIEFTREKGNALYFVYRIEGIR